MEGLMAMWLRSQKARHQATEASRAESSGGRAARLARRAGDPGVERGGLGDVADEFEMVGTGGSAGDEVPGLKRREDVFALGGAGGGETGSAQNAAESAAELGVDELVLHRLEALLADGVVEEQAVVAVAVVEKDGVALEGNLVAVAGDRTGETVPAEGGEARAGGAVGQIEIGVAP